jgi:major membrane immunogen (membrane-anchored lipoprotein)
MSKITIIIFALLLTACGKSDEEKIADKEKVCAKKASAANDAVGQPEWKIKEAYEAIYKECMSKKD